MKFAFASRIRLVALLIASMPALVSADPPAVFSPRGIGGGGALYSPTINPLNPNEMALSCDMSPQFNSIDDGKSWTLTDFRQLQSGHEGAIHYTKNPLIRWSINYAPANGDDRARPVRSIDGGKTWQPFPEKIWPSSRKAYVLRTDFNDPDRALISADYGELWITLDGGKSFQKKITGANPDSGLHLAGAFFDGPNIYAGLNDGLYISTDGGKNFARSTIPGIPVNAFIVSFTGGKAGGKIRLFCVTLNQGWAGITGDQHVEYNGIYVLDPDQKSWTRQTTGIPKNIDPFFVAMAANDINTAYVAGGRNEGLSGPSVYKTTDGGKNWSDVFLIEHNQNIATAWDGDGGDFHWSFPEYALGFDVCRSDPNRLLLTDLGCAHASDDGGRTWRAVYNTPTRPPAVGPCQRGEPYISNGLEVTSIWQILWLDQNSLFACATDIRGFRSADGGKSWAFNYVGDSFSTMYHAVIDPDSHTAYAAVSDVHDMYESTYLEDKRIDKGKGAVLASTDGGASWSPVGNLPKPVVWVTLDPKNHDRLYAAMVNSKVGDIYRCDDPRKGRLATWTRLATPLRTQGHPYNILILDDGSLLCTYSGRRDAKREFTPSSGVFLSTDQGKTWQDRTDFRMAYWTKDIVIDPADKTQSTWYAGVFHAWGKSARDGGAGLFRTTDRGKNWTPITTDALAPSAVLNVESAAFDPLHPGQFYFSTEYDGLYFCPDIHTPTPQFSPVKSYPFKHPMRIEFNPYHPNQMWITSFGNALRVGDTTP